MKEKIHQIAKHPLIQGSSIILIGSFIANLFNYVFANLILGRLLMTSDYGIYATLISFLALFGVFPAALTQIFAKLSAVYKIKDDAHHMATLFFGGLKIVLLFGIVILLILTFSSFSLSSLLHIEDMRLLFLVFFTIFISILASLTNGMLQGEMRMHLLSFLAIVTPLIKIIVGVAALLLGLKVFGVTFAIFISSLLPVAIVLVLFLRKYKGEKISSTHLAMFATDFKEYRFKFFFATLGIAFLTSADILFVRHFLSPVETGQYAALSAMGRSIFYLTSPIYFVLFPLIAQKKERKEGIFNTLLLAVFIIMACSLSLSFIYFLFPTIILDIFFPLKEYRVLTSYLGLFSLYITAFSLAMLSNNFMLSIGKSGVYKINLLVAALMGVLLYLFHNSFYQIIGVLFGTSLLLLVLHLLYYVLTRHEES